MIIHRAKFLLPILCIGLANLNGPVSDFKLRSAEPLREVQHWSGVRIHSNDTLPPYRPLSEFKGKYVNYLQANFSDRKELFIGKPIKVILDQLELPLTTYELIQNERDSTEYIGISIRSKIVVDNHPDRKNERTASAGLEITWKESEPAVQAKEIWKSNSGKWTNMVAALYGQRVVEDIRDAVIYVPVETAYEYEIPNNHGDTLASYLPLKEFGKDTAAYLISNFEKRNGLYLHKPLEVLLEQLEMSILKHQIDQDFFKKVNTNIVFSFNQH